MECTTSIMNLKKLIIFGVLIVHQVCHCIDILSKFHQTDYKLKNLRVDVSFVNKTLMHEFRAIGYKYNRTTTAFNVTVSPKIDFGNKLECVMQAYKRASNEYRLFPMRFQVNACKVMQTNVMGLQNIGNYGNYTLCNWKKDAFYYIRGFPVDESHLPPLVPTGEYKSQVETFYEENHAATINLYAEIYRAEV